MGSNGHPHYVAIFPCSSVACVKLQWLQKIQTFQIQMLSTLKEMSQLIEYLANDASSVPLASDTSESGDPAKTATPPRK